MHIIKSQNNEHTILSLELLTPTLRILIYNKGDQVLSGSGVACYDYLDSQKVHDKCKKWIQIGERYDLASMCGDVASVSHYCEPR